MAPSIPTPPALGYGVIGVSADTVQTIDVLAAAQQIAAEHPGGTPALARALDMPASTLEKKLNPNNAQHKLTLMEALAMQQATGKRYVLHAMAAQLGCTCLAATPVQSLDAFEAFLRFQQEVSELTCAATDGLRRPSPNARRRVDYAANELIAAITQLAAAVAARVPTRGGTL